MMNFERTTFEAKSSPAAPAALTLDAHGRITHSNPAASALLGRTTEELTGQAVATVIQGLPFVAATPGYNMAYAVFHAADGAWAQRTALSADGRQLPVETAVAFGTLDGERRITLRLRPQRPTVITADFMPREAVACL